MRTGDAGTYRASICGEACVLPLPRWQDIETCLILQYSLQGSAADDARWTLILIEDHDRITAIRVDPDVDRHSSV